MPKFKCSSVTQVQMSKVIVNLWKYTPFVKTARHNQLYTQGQML